MNTYEIAFSGQVAAGADPQQVRQGVQRLFNAGEALLEQFFSGRRVVVKRGLDQAAAEKYRQAFASVGALVEVVGELPASSATIPAPAPAPTPTQTQTQTQTPAPAPAPAPAAAPAVAAGPGILEVVPRDEYMAAFAHVQAPDFGLAAVGEDLLREKPPAEAVQVDVSGISLAPAGSDLEQLPGAEPITPPDISHLSIESID